MAKNWFKSARPGAAAAPCSWEGWTLSVAAMLLAAGVVLIAPGIRDNLLRPLFLVAGLALVLVPYFLIARSRGSGHRG